MSMACLYDSEGNLLSCVKLVKANEQPIIYNAYCEKLSILEVVKTNKTAIHILLATSEQVRREGKEDNGRNDFNVECVQKIANAINELEPKSTRIIVNSSSVDRLEDSLKPFGVFPDIELVMWGDHAGSPPDDNGRVSRITGVFASGYPDDWAYVHQITGFLTRGNPKTAGDRPREIRIKSEPIKLINYGCWGNTSDNQRRFNDVFRPGNYLGKYNGPSSDKVITLDMINDLLTIGKAYAENLNVTWKELLKDTFGNVFRDVLTTIREYGMYFEIKVEDPRFNEARRKQFSEELSKRAKNIYNTIECRLRES
jgi:hypothetical protein